MSVFSDAWEQVERRADLPSRARQVLTMDFSKVQRAVETKDSWLALELARCLYAGDLLILKGAFHVAEMHYIRDAASAFMRSAPSSFHKMLEGSPDFHRAIDLESGRKYSFACCKHSAYFYRWNDDPLGIWPMVTQRWRIIKQLMGLKGDEYERNTPKDGVVDRIQVVRYPPAIGFLEPHADPHLHQRLFFSGYMSKRGVDYHGGGFYAIGVGDRVMDIERYIEIGDACVGYATVYHGVAPCDRTKTPDWNDIDGRWFLSMYSNASDEVPNRHTGRPVKLNIPEVLP
jgi:hypothetical protein